MTSVLWLELHGKLIVCHSGGARVQRPEVTSHFLRKVRRFLPIGKARGRRPEVTSLFYRRVRRFLPVWSEAGSEWLFFIGEWGDSALLVNTWSEAGSDVTSFYRRVRKFRPTTRGCTEPTCSPLTPPSCLGSSPATSMYKSTRIALRECVSNIYFKTTHLIND